MRQISNSILKNIALPITLNLVVLICLHCSPSKKKPYEDIYGNTLFILTSIDQYEKRIYDWDEATTRYFIEIQTRTTFSCISKKFDKNFDNPQENRKPAHYQVEGDFLLFSLNQCPFPLPIKNLKCSYKKAEGFLMNTRYLHCKDPENREYSFYSGGD